MTKNEKLNIIIVYIYTALFIYHFFPVAMSYYLVLFREGMCYDNKKKRKKVF